MNKPTYLNEAVNPDTVPFTEGMAIHGFLFLKQLERNNLPSRLIEQVKGQLLALVHTSTLDEDFINNFTKQILHVGSSSEKAA